MKHLFLPYELALIAKEKGFDEKCLAYYVNESKEFRLNADKVFSNTSYTGTRDFLTTAPLYQQIIDFLNEIGDKKHLNTYVVYDGFNIKLLNIQIEESFKLIENDI